MGLRKDHSASAALRALQVNDDAVPGGVTRRSFLVGLGAAATAVAVGGRPWSRPAAAAEAARNLVVFLLPGGNDGFATVQPTTPSALDLLRAPLLNDRSTLLPIGGGFGLHPGLPALHNRFTAGDVAIVGGVGASGSLSHFASLDEWMNGSTTPTATGVRGTGWLGRWLDTLGTDDAHPLRAVSLTGRVPQLLVGRSTGGIGIGRAGADLYGASRPNPASASLFSMIERGAPDIDPAAGRSLAASVAARSAALAPMVVPAYSPVLPGDAGRAQGTLAARLLNNTALGCRTVFCALDENDPHVSEVAAQATSMAQVDAAVAALFEGLDSAVAARTVALVFSEFGRRAAINGGAGTDHGTAGYAFVVGQGVAGGHYGSHLDPTRLDGNGNPVSTVRHLDLIGSIVGPWLGADATAVVGPGVADLGLFEATPSPPVTTTTVAPITTTTVAPVTTTTTVPTTTSSKPGKPARTAPGGSRARAAARSAACVN